MNTKVLLNPLIMPVRLLGTHKIGPTTNITHAYLWMNGNAIDLETLGRDYSEAYAINNRGQIVGVADDASGENYVILWKI